MWPPYLKVIAKKAPQALNILNRFHIVFQLTKAVNQVRVDEVKRLKDDGELTTANRCAGDSRHARRHISQLI